nr:unnamed protein product [Digitaria exilis]
MASPFDSSSNLWTMLGQASNVAQLVGVDALGLVSMVVQAALAARRHRDACRRLAQHVEIVGGLLRELELAELMRREATRRPLEQLGGALRRCYALVAACQDCGYLCTLLTGARMAEELRAAEQEIDMFIRLVPLISLVDSTHAHRVKGQLTSGVMFAIKRLDERATLFDFSSELQLASLEHINLVRLLGWCVHGKERLLVYEFMHNGSLDRIIFGIGYIAPEYASRGLYSVKIDVFGFGVLSLVIISGRKNIILEEQGDTVGNLVRDAWQLWKDGRLHELADPLLGDGYEIDEMVRIIHVALLRTQEDPVDRPTMSDVIAFLNFRSTSLLPDPKPPSELINNGDVDFKLSTYIGQQNRTIDITITSSAPVSTRVRIIVEPET